jgi:ferredoxin-NADP reductase/fatty acid desaturase
MNSTISTALQQPHSSDARYPVTLSQDLLALYEQTRARMGDEDLVHIRRVAAYSRAIKARSRELIQQGGKEDALRRGITLYMLHVLLEFSELGHNIMHGSYDNLPGVDEFHSERWVWDFVTDAREWKVMHHQNHHPFTNIVGVDHDIGYSFLRLKPGQDWFGHHVLQPAILLSLMTTHLYHFSIYTATSAARTEGKRVLRLETFNSALKLIKNHALQNYIREPLKAGPRFLHTLLGNYLGTTLGYDLTIGILMLEHHADNVQLFPDPGTEETQDDYFRRQLLATSNFTPIPEVDDYFKNILAEEVDFLDSPGFEVFYGGLDTHLEHHLFPDLPCNRQREIAPQVRTLCAKHGLSYNTVALADVVPDLLKSLAHFAFPTGEAEKKTPGSLFRHPRELANRLMHGLRYRTPSPTTYLQKPRFFNVPVKVLEAMPVAGGKATVFRLEKPAGWNEVVWDAGAFISLRVTVGNETLVRQYSLTRDSLRAGSLDIVVKRVRNGRVSNYLNDALKKGQTVILVGKPVSDGSFVMKTLPPRALFLAAGVGITPLISMIRTFRREAPQADTTLLYFNHDEHSIIFEKELRELAKESGLKLHFICSERPSHRTGLSQGRLSQELLSGKIIDLNACAVYACAPPGFIEAAKQHLGALGLSPENFYTESFTPPALLRPLESDGLLHRIKFRRSGKEITVSSNTTLLEAARQAGINAPAGCERGLCKACVCSKRSGVTQYDEGQPIAQTRVTICNSLPRSEIELDL